ncbi:MAG: hypothetical protein LBM62_05760 [Mediterranea sp.]|jgi:hypothetical protein|nr:hypothetical protein [Mediterranea sp.]
MKLSQTSLSQLEAALKKAVCGYTCTENGQSIVTDIHLQVNPNSGELIVFNDDEEELATVVIEEWMTDQGDNFYKEVERVLASLLGTMKERGAFDKVSAIMKPYSFVLVDDDKETLAELLLVDDDTLLLNDCLMEGLDEELDAFLKNLLEK